MTIALQHETRFPYAEFPEGWFAVAWADEVPRGKAVALQAFGQDLVAFRDADGRVRLMEAYCPHLGAHLGHGGTVVDGTVVCPFHGWSFDEGGHCTKAPGSRKLPARSDLRTWHVCELHGRIFAWHGVVSDRPTWALPTTLLSPTQRWSMGGRVDRTFASHPQDIVENAVDPLHFRFVHGMSEVVDAQTEYRDECITTRLEVKAYADRFGFKGFPLEAVIVVRVYGLGLQTIQTSFSIEPLGLDIDTMVVEGLAPRGQGQASLLIDVHMSGLKIPGAARMARRAFVKAVADDVDADIEVWAHRRHLDRPRLTAADSEIGRYRQWARRFYPAAS